MLQTSLCILKEVFLSIFSRICVCVQNFKNILKKYSLVTVNLSGSQTDDYINNITIIYIKSINLEK